ncbi:hypothetical protein ACH41H_44130 [Streptomyces sp. NPDC020800]|uniref:hypothetical protein n=1 Tax=Streptomyces sp. NPDC020800 TaxID=3365092 RepID=UPI003797840C
MWFFDSLASAFHHPTDPGRLQQFRLVFGTVCALRFALSIGQGGWDRFAQGSLTSFVTEHLFGQRRARLLATAYRPALIVRTIAAIALALGLAPRLSLTLVLAGIVMELLYLKSQHGARYALLTGACLLLAGNPGHGLHIDHAPSTANTWAQCLLVLITTDIYWNSAWQKIRSVQFRSGLYLAQWIHTYNQVREQLPYGHQYGIPGFVRRHAGNLGHRDVRLWRLVAITVIAVEIALPPALLIPQTTPYAVVVGIGMHMAFTCLKPRQLIMFSGLTVGTYLAFVA